MSDYHLPAGVPELTFAEKRCISYLADAYALGARRGYEAGLVDAMRKAERINVEAFGADPIGENDSTGAFQAAVDAVAGKENGNGN